MKLWRSHGKDYRWTTFIGELLLKRNQFPVDRIKKLPSNIFFSILLNFYYFTFIFFTPPPQRLFFSFLPPSLLPLHPEILLDRCQTEDFQNFPIEYIAFTNFSSPYFCFIFIYLFLTRKKN